MLFDEMKRTNDADILDVKKTYCPNPVKINTILKSKNNMQHGINNKLKQVLTACTK